MLSVVWGMRLLGVLLGSVLVNQVFGSACADDASRTAVFAGLERLSWVTPLVLLGLGVASVFGVERRTTGLMVSLGSEPPDVPQRLSLPQLLLQLRSIPQAGRFLGVRVMPIPAAWPPSVEAGCLPCSKLGTGVSCSLPMAVFLPCRWFVSLVPL